MPSPFPGMDPYLEGEMWQEFHQTLANEISIHLLPQLRPNYVALLGKRYGRDRCPQLSVEIRDVAQRRLVTDIEILSPANKTGEGVREYTDRRTDLLRTRTHLLEIDLLRGGTRIELLEPVPPAPYYVYLTYGDDSATAPIWAVQLRDRLPTVPVPLLKPDPAVPLNLQAALESCFALVGYERLLDYTQPPPPPDLGPEDSVWVKGVLAEAGLRS